MKNQQPAGEGAHSFKKVSRTAGPEGPRDATGVSEPKKQRMKKQESRMSMGAYATTGKDVVLDNRSKKEGGPALHNGRQIPAPTRSVDLTDEVRDLSPGGRKRK
jgi:hypothetical protein